MGARDLGALVLLGVLWGGSFLFIRVGVPELGPVALVELRVGIAAVALVICAAVLGRMPKVRSRWRQFAILGAVNAAIPFCLISAAEIHLTASLSAILNSTTVMFTALVAAVWMGDPLTLRKGVGVVLGIVGVAVLVGWDPIVLDWAVVLSVVAILGASLSYALAAVYAKRTFAGSPPLAIAVGQQTAASLLLLPLAAVSLPAERPSVAATVSVLALALLSTAVAYMLYYRLIANVGPTSTVTVTLLVPVFGLLLGVLILDEPFGLGTLAGLGIILSSVALITGIGFGGPKAKARA
jgi:drug/metabolite transporter (DMT)-like permease